MYAIEEGLQKINGEMVETFEREVTCGNTVLEVEAGTTGYKGGCCRTGCGRTFLSLLCMKGNIFFGPIEDDEGNIAGITIACCGDDGLKALMKALEFAHEAINESPMQRHWRRQSHGTMSARNIKTATAAMPTLSAATALLWSSIMIIRRILTTGSHRRICRIPSLR